MTGRALEWIPGLPHWRHGRRRTALAFAVCVVLPAALLLWRLDAILPAAGNLLEAFLGSSVAPVPRRLDIVFSALVLVTALAGAVVGSRTTSRRFRGRSPGEAVPPERGVEGPWRVFREQFRKNHLALAGVTIVVLLSAVALLCPLLAPHHPLEQGDILDDRLRPPSYEHPLGTDRLARDVLSRIVYGSRVSMVVGLLSMAIAVGIGTAYGAVAGYFGGWIDGLLMRLVDVFLAFPSIILIITVVHLWDDQSLWVIAVIIGMLSWMRIARLVRGQFLKLKETEFFLAARSLGAGAGRLILRHLLPNALTPIIVASTLGIGNTILVEASLSYLGLGVQQPTPSWGNIVSDNASAGQWGIAFLSGTAIVITVVGYNLLGDGLRDALDPRERR